MKVKQMLFLTLFLVLVSACRKNNDNAYGYNETKGFEVKKSTINGGQIAMINELS